MPSVLTILLNWRTAEMTLRAAEAALLALDGIEGALTIVDNDSGDGSFERLSAEVVARGWDIGPQRVRVLQSGHNGGFGAGNNFAIRAGLPAALNTDGDGLAGGSKGERPDYVYLLNSDAFPEPQAIKHLLAHLEAQPSLGIAGSFILGEDGEPHRTAFRFPSAWGEFEAQIRFGPVTRLLRRHVIAMPIPEQDARVDWVAGASMMLRQNMLDQIGLFDERFFLYFEETDLCRRAAIAGWPTEYLPGSRVIHIGSVSTGMKTSRRIPSYWLDSRLYYFTKNHGRFGLWRATVAALLGGGIWQLRILLQRKAPQDPPHFLGDMMRHHLRHFRRHTLGQAPDPRAATALAATSDSFSASAAKGPKA